MAEELYEQPVEVTNETEPEVVQEDAVMEEVQDEAGTEEIQENDGPEAAENNGPEIAFSWEASEYVHNHKSMMWYVVLGLVFAIPAGFAVWLHLWLEIGVIVGAACALAIYAHKPPRVMKYELSNEGVHIDGKLYSFGEFRSFGVIPDEEWHSIDLEPVKRLNIRRVILFDTVDFEEIVGHLELHLPREDRPLDVIERITRYVRF